MKIQQNEPGEYTLYCLQYNTDDQTWWMPVLTVGADSDAEAREALIGRMRGAITDAPCLKMMSSEQMRNANAAGETD